MPSHYYYIILWINLHCIKIQTSFINWNKNSFVNKICGLAHSLIYSPSSFFSAIGGRNTLFKIVSIINNTNFKMLLIKITCSFVRYFHAFKMTTRRDLLTFSWNVCWYWSHQLYSYQMNACKHCLNCRNLCWKLVVLKW